MEKSKTYDICIYVALFITVISLIVTYKTQVDIKREIAAFTAPYAESETVTYTARNNNEAFSETEMANEQEIDKIDQTETTINTTVNSNSSITTSALTEKTQNTTVKVATTKASKVTTTKAPKVTTTKTEKVTELDSVLILNTNSKKIHSSTCSYASNMKEENKATISSDEMQDYLNDGYTLCSRCHGCKTVEG